MSLFSFLLGSFVLFNRRKLFEYFLKKSLNVPQYDISISIRHRVHLIFLLVREFPLQAYADVSNFDGRPAILDIRRVFHSNKVDAEEKMIYKYRSCVIQFVRFYKCRRLNHSFNFRKKNRANQVIY